MYFSTWIFLVVAVGIAITYTHIHILIMLLIDWYMQCIYIVYILYNVYIKYIILYIVYGYTTIGLCVYMYMCILISLYVCVYIYMCVYVYTYIQIYIYVCIYMLIYVYVIYSYQSVFTSVFYLWSIDKLLFTVSLPFPIILILNMSLKLRIISDYII
jgi:hypothetical protein